MVGEKKKMSCLYRHTDKGKIRFSTLNPIDILGVFYTGFAMKKKKKKKKTRRSLGLMDERLVSPCTLNSIISRACTTCTVSHSITISFFIFSLAFFSHHQTRSLSLSLSLCLCLSLSITLCVLDRLPESFYRPASSSTMQGRLSFKFSRFSATSSVVHNIL